MNDKKIRKLVLAALLAALVCVATMVVQIPSPMQGYVNLGDCFVLLSGWLLGPWYGFAAGGIGSMLADIFLGYGHYAPGTPVTLFSAKDIAALAASNDKVAVMATADVLDACKKSFGNRIVLELVMSCEEADWQHSLYENLHRLDKSGAARLLIEQPPQTPEWAAVNDRLGRAAAAKDA
mgnify:CR=1 FL=1